jgi:hypothetical protein
VSGKRVRQTRHRGLNFFLTVVAAVLVVGLLGWWVTRLVTGDDGTPHSAGGGAGPSTSASPGGNSSDAGPSGSGDNSGGNDVAAALRRCVDQLHQVQAAVAAARPGVRSWHRHVQARTDWLAGRISQERLDEIYAQSKHRGHVVQPKYAKAVASVDHSRPCTGLRHVDASDKRVKDCRTRSRAAAAALAAAQRAMGDWAAHLHHMAQYADGGMSSGRAMKLWVAAWRKAPAGIKAYDERAADLAAAPACVAS